MNSLLTCSLLKVPTQKVMELLDDFIDSIHSDNKTQFKLARMRMNTVILEGRYTNKTKEVGNGSVMKHCSCNLHDSMLKRLNFSEFSVQ